jgi:glycine/D-amino acid oxidase-like deaminating enzyme
MAEDVDLVVVGGGVMGLFTAYYASAVFDRVVVLERSDIGDPTTASFGRTRSYRRDYLDPVYARFAEQAMGLWTDFERATGTEVLVRCGCMNIASKSITPDLATTYAQLATDTLDRLGMAQERLDTAQLEQRFPYLRADLGYLDATAGLVDLATVTATLQRALATHGVTIHEQAEITRFERSGERVHVVSNRGEFAAGAVVLTAGHGTNDVLAQLPGCHLQVPITKDRPSEAKYFVPPAGQRELFTADAMPVIAYLDTGVYVHPIVGGVIDAVKIGYYNPPDLPQQRTGIANIADFVAQCMPGLLQATSRDVVDVDQCDYDLVADDDFVLGAVPGQPGVFVGVGWRGTGYKFAPWVGRVLFELALRDGTIYDIARFDPARFTHEEES